MADGPAPEQAVLLDIHHPWLDGANWDDNTPPVVYGVDTTRDEPRFSVVDPNAQCLWVQRLSLPIDMAKYPILTMKYRARNTSNTAAYLLRLVGGAGGNRNRFDVFKGTDLAADGQVHELKQDLRELNVEGSLNTIGIGFRTDDQPAWMELVEMKLSADAAGGERFKEESALRIRVTDMDGKPIAGAKVTVDAERSNFAKGASTDQSGDTAVNPLANELQKHMVRVEKEGYLTMELPSAVSESGQALIVKTMPATSYGGTVAPLSQVSIKLKPELLQELPMRFQTNIVADDKGQWASAPLPADASQLMIAQTVRDEAGKPAVTQLDAAKLKRSKPATPIANVTPVAPNGISGRPMPAAAAVAPAMPEPESAVVLDLFHPWIDASKWERNTPPVAYGIDMTRPAPRINLLDTDAKTMWAMKLTLPIDTKRYPIVSLKYRASNPGSKTEYVLRLAHGAPDNRTIAKFFKPEDIKADGQVHELTADLRERKVDDPVMEVAIALWSDDKPAWLDVLGLSFSAAPDAPAAQKLGDDPEIKFTVTTLDGQVLAGATVTVDAERLNFARNAVSDEKGQVAIKPGSNESRLHMARVAKTGYMTIDRAVEGNTAEMKTVLAVRYGGAATTDGGQVAKNAQITVRGKNQFLRDTGQQVYPMAIVTTDEKGQWSTPPLPADKDLVTIQAKIPTNGGEPVTSDIDVAKSQLAAAGWTEYPPKGAMLAAAPVDSNRPADGGKPATKPASAIAADAQPAQPVPQPKQPAAPKPAANPVTAIVQKVDDSTTGVGWTGVDGDQILVVLHPQPGKDEPAKIPLMDITEIVLKKAAAPPAPPPPATRPADTLPNARLTLIGDDRILGTLLGWSDKRLKLKPAIAPGLTIEIPVSNLRQLWCGTADQIKKAQALKEPPGLEDVAYVTSDSDVIAVRGIAIDMKDDKLVFRYDNEERKISLGKLVGLVMAKAEDPPADEALYTAVQFITDDQISGKLIAMDGKDLSMQTRAGVDIRVPVEQIAKIATRNGRQAFLSDMKPAKVEQTPYFDRLLEYRIDKSLTGKPITMVDGTYQRGISVHSRCVLTYNLDGRFAEFRSKVGFQLPEGKIGQAAIRVLGDGQALYENLEAKGDQPPADLKLKVEGVRELKLEVDYGKNDDVGDRVAWANARLLRSDKK